MKTILKILTCTLLVVLLFTITTVLVSCGGKDLTPEYGFSVLEELDEEEISRRYKLLNKYETYKYLELRVEYFEGTEDPIKTENIFIHNIFNAESGEMDLLIYVETASINGITYDLIKKDRPEGYSFYHSERESNEDELIKDCVSIITETEYKEVLNTIFNKYFNASILPVQESDIYSVSKKSISLSASTIMTIELIFDGKYENEKSLNSVRFNYNTDKIHNVSNYSEDGTTLLRTVEYIYPGNAVTDPTKIDYNLFSKEGHAEIVTKEENRIEPTCTSTGSVNIISYCKKCDEVISSEIKELEKLEHDIGDSIKENVIESTCSSTGSYDEVVYCSICNYEISRETKIIDKASHINGDIKTENVIESTCSSTGSYDEVVYCSVCNGEISRENKIIEKIEHSGEGSEPVITVTKMPTCLEKGSCTEIIYCIYGCNTEISKNNVVLKELSHKDSDSNLVCDTCNTFFGEVWDGTIGILPEPNENNVREISTPAQFAAFAKAVNDGIIKENEKIILTTSFSLGNLPWTPIGCSENEFIGIFDGNKHTIYDISINGNEYVGLFGKLGVASKIMNLNINNATIQGSHYVGGLVGYIQSADGNHTIVIDGCNIKNISVNCISDGTFDETGKSNNGDKAGALAGYAVRTNIMNCTVEDSSVSGARDAGQLVGHLNTNSKIENSTVNNVIVTDNNGIQNIENNDNVKNEFAGRITE